MGFFSFMGRLLFASIFILSAWQMFNEFGVDGGPAAKELAPKVGQVRDILISKLGVKLPEIEVRQLVATSMVIKGLGGVLFVFGSSFGAYLLLLHLLFSTPFLYEFYNYGPAQPEFFSLLHEFLQNVALFGALLFFLGMKNSLPRRQMKKKAPKPKTV
ncbi:uncharacterized protein LOC141656513 [Silene latifolia]|uniref:uncharacterized protein LOC141656513 n=1 Tax=Silene latifolia TaxID=37657 RepID=UPI003D785458